MRSKGVKILFVCTGNEQRSPTAEHIYKTDGRFLVKSAGTSRFANKPVDRELLQWADYIVVMEEDHKRKIVTRFPDIASNTPIFSLDIPDVYYFMEAALVEEIRWKFERVYRDHIQQTE